MHGMRTNNEEIVSNPVFIPKRMQMQTKTSFVSNEKYHKFKKKEISVNRSLFPTNSFKSKTINSVNTSNTHMIPVRAEVHQQIPDHQNSANSQNFVDIDKRNDLPKMSSIKSILKTRSGESVANGVIRHKSNQFVGKAIINVNKLTHKTHNQDFNIGNAINSGSTPSSRRKSSSVQFDFNNIKESTRIQLNPNNRGLTSISSARRESSNSSSSISIIQQSVPANPVLTYDFPKPGQKISDLRKILNPEIEKEDSLKKLGERLIHCDCFELNLNNAAKIITALVLVATIILVIRAIYYSFY